MDVDTDTSAAAAEGSSDPAMCQISAVRASSNGKVTFQIHASHVSKLRVDPYNCMVLNNVCIAPLNIDTESIEADLAGGGGRQTLSSIWKMISQPTTNVYPDACRI
jgi:hypothetical protein